MSSNPYTAPSAPIADVAEAVPLEIEKKIRSAWVAACISGAITLVLTAIAISGTNIFGVSAWSLLDVAIIFGLAFGIYKKSRTCAVIMLVYFMLSKIYLMVEAGKPSGFVMAFVFGYYFWQGVRGTFAFHKLKRTPAVLVAR